MCACMRSNGRVMKMLRIYRQKTCVVAQWIKVVFQTPVGVHVLFVFVFVYVYLVVVVVKW